MPTVRILESYCKGCGLCVWVCQQQGLAMADELNESGVYTARPVAGIQCTGCGRCAQMCPEGGIEIDVEESAQPSSAEPACSHGVCPSRTV